MTGETLEKPPAVKPPRKRVARKRKKETKRRIVWDWFKSRFQRVGGALFSPKNTFKEIVKDPDYGGILIVGLSCVLVGVMAQYTLWVAKLSFYDVDQNRHVSLPFPYGNYATSETLGFVLYNLFLNFGLYYLCSWILKGQRNARTLFVCTAYTLSTQLIGRILQVGVFYTLFPSVEYWVSADTVLILMTTSIQLLQLHQRGWAEVEVRNEGVYGEWQRSPPVLGFRFATYFFNIWTAILAVVAVKYAARFSWKKAAVTAGVVLVKDSIFFIQSFLS